MVSLKECHSYFILPHQMMVLAHCLYSYILYSNVDCSVGYIRWHMSSDIMPHRCALGQSVGLLFHQSGLNGVGIKESLPVAGELVSQGYITT